MPRRGASPRRTQQQQVLLLLLLAASQSQGALMGKKCGAFVEAPSPWALDTPGPEVTGGAASVDTSSTAPVRQPCVGYLLGIGVQKGGTSALWEFLRCGLHPRVWARPEFKEMMYFDWLHTEGSTLRDWYHERLGKRLSPAADLHTLCPEARSNVFRSAKAEGRRRCDQHLHLRCRRREQPGAPLDGRAMWPYNVSTLRPAPFYLTDISPSYMMHPDVPINVRSILPEARVVILLRDPVARAASAFNMIWQEKRKPADRDSEEAFQKAFTEEIGWELQLLESCYREALAKANGSDADVDLLLQGPDLRPCLGIRPSTMWTSMDEHYRKFQEGYKWLVMPQRHVMHGVYVDILATWFVLFPRAQLLVWASEDFKADPIKHMWELVDWLGLDPNLTAKARAEPLHERPYRFQLPRETMEALRTFYRPHNKRLFDLLRAKGFAAQAARLEELWT